MENMKKLHIFNRLYKFALWLMEHTSKFPKSHRFSLGVRMENTVLDAIELVTQANMQINKVEFIRTADQKLHFLKILLRISYEKRFFNITSYEYGANELVEIGKMMGGWMKQQKGGGD